MENLPEDPAILMSFLNMKLRDNYKSLNDLCEDLNIDKRELLRKMSELGFEYSEENNKFW